MTTTARNFVVVKNGKFIEDFATRSAASRVARFERGTVMTVAAAVKSGAVDARRESDELVAKFMARLDERSRHAIEHVGRIGGR